MFPFFTIQVLKSTKEAADLSQPNTKADRVNAETVEAESCGDFKSLFLLS